MSAHLHTFASQACRGRVDEYVEPYLQLVLGRLAAKPAPSSALKDLLLNVVADALFYNPELTLKILQKHGALAATFSTWSQVTYQAFQPAVWPCDTQAPQTVLFSHVLCL